MSKPTLMSKPLSLTQTAARAGFHEAGLPHPHLYHHNKNQCVCSGTGFEITFIPKVNFFADVKSSLKNLKIYQNQKFHSKSRANKTSKDFSILFVG